MSKKYFVWKDPNCNGANPEWIEMKGKEFFSFVKQEENKRRRFIKLTNEINLVKEVLYFESTETQYKEWRKEKNAHYHLSKINQPYETISMDYPYGEIDHHELHEIIADEKSNIERNFFFSIELELLVNCLELLTELERRAIIMAFWCMPNKTDTEISEKLKIDRSAFCKRKNRAIKKLKIFLSDDVPK